MEQGNSNTEETLSAVSKVKGTSHGYYERTSANPLTVADVEMHSDHSSDGDDHCNISAEAQCSNVKEKCIEKKMAHSSCHQIVPETESELETSKINVNSQESSCNSTDLNIEQDFQTPEKGKLHFNSGDLSLFGVAPIISVCPYDSQKAFKPEEPILVKLIDPVVVKYIKELIDKLVGVESLSLREFQQSTEQKTAQSSHNRNYVQELPHEMDIISDFENISGSPSQEIAKSYPGNKPEISEDSKESIIKHQRIKFRKDFEMLSDILDEVGRMNDYFSKDIIYKNREAGVIHSLAAHMEESLQIMEGLSSYIVTVDNEEGEPYCLLNVHEFGLKVLQQSVILLTYTYQIITAYNNFRLKFHDFSETFLSNPLEQLFGSKQNDEIEKIVEMSRSIYRDFFEDEQYHSSFQLLESNKKHLEHLVDEFDLYLDKLAAQDDYPR